MQRVPVREIVSPSLVLLFFMSWQTNVIVPGSRTMPWVNKNYNYESQWVGWNNLSANSGRRRYVCVGACARAWWCVCVGVCVLVSVCVCAGVCVWWTGGVSVCVCWWGKCQHCLPEVIKQNLMARLFTWFALLQVAPYTRDVPRLKTTQFCHQWGITASCFSLPQGFVLSPFFSREGRWEFNIRWM